MNTRTVRLFLTAAVFCLLISTLHAEDGYWKKLRVEKLPGEAREEQWWKVVPGNIGTDGITVTYFSCNGPGKLDGGQYTGSFLWLTDNLFDTLQPGKTFSARCRVFIHGRKKTKVATFSGSVSFRSQSNTGKGLGKIEVRYAPKSPDKSSVSKTISGTIPGQEGYGSLLKVRFLSKDGRVDYVYEWKKGKVPEKSAPDKGPVKKPGDKPGDKPAGKPYAGTGGVPAPAGGWDFDDANKLATSASGSALKCDGSGIKAAKGIDDKDGAVEIDSGSNLIVTVPAKPDRGKCVNTYTILWDIFVPESSKGKWVSLLQTNQKNQAENDGDLFFNKKGQVGCGEGLGGYSDRSLKYGKWHRVVFRVDNGKARAVFVDGEKWLDGGKGFVDDRYSLEKTVRIAADDSGDDATIRISKISIWDRCLTDAEIVALGKPGKKPKRPAPKPGPGSKNPKKPSPGSTEEKKPKKPGKRTGVLSMGGGGMPVEIDRISPEDPKEGIKGTKEPYSGEAAVYWSPTQIRELYTFTNGRRTGPWKKCYKDGKLKESGQLVKGVKRGWFKEWDENGKGICTKFYRDDNGIDRYPFEHDPKKPQTGENKGMEGVKHLSLYLVEHKDRSPWEKFSEYEVGSYDGNNMCWVFQGLKVKDLIVWAAAGKKLVKESHKRHAKGISWQIEANGETRYIRCNVREVNVAGRRLGYVVDLAIAENRKELKGEKGESGEVDTIKTHIYKK